MVDPALLRRACKVLLLAGLVALLLLRGVMPALTAITSDFPEYFTSAKSVRDGQDAAKLYDGAWFREQTRRYAVGPRKIPVNLLLIHPQQPYCSCPSRDLIR